MRCHVCRQEIIQFIPWKGTPSPIPCVLVPLNKPRSLFFCEGDRGQMYLFELAAQVAVGIEAGDILPLPGKSRKASIDAVLQLGMEPGQLKGNES